MLRLLYACKARFSLFKFSWKGCMMRKKIVIVLMVVVMASVANAALSWGGLDSYNASTGVATVTLNSNTYVKAINIFQMTSAVTGTWAVVSDAFYSNLGPSNTATTLGGWSGNLEAGDEIGVTGVLATFTLTVPTSTDMSSGIAVTLPNHPAIAQLKSYATEMNDDKTYLAGLPYTITPEPMTMALLGLGGLFLRRRK
ncbi:MAG: PEP-CTERM sorting domain-containing protein [Planctomycetes bacterium]|nr:PEP-CTERM sorting domain-containing protein [Planctomycetota bacterium]